MGDSNLVLRDAVIAIRTALKQRGFSRKGTNFFRKLDNGNTILLSLQKSIKSSPAEALVTINYGVYSARIGEKLSGCAVSAFDVGQAHWRKRLVEAGGEKWVSVKATDAAEERAQFIVAAIDAILADLLGYSTDEALCALWLYGSSPGVGNMQRLLYLAVLINEIGPSDRLPSVVRELRSLVVGTIHERLVERQLATAGVRLL